MRARIATAIAAMAALSLAAAPAAPAAKKPSKRKAPARWEKTVRVHTAQPGAQLLVQVRAINCAKSISVQVEMDKRYVGGRRVAPGRKREIALPVAVSPGWHRVVFHTPRQKRCRLRVGLVRVKPAPPAPANAPAPGDAAYVNAPKRRVPLGAAVDSRPAVWNDNQYKDAFLRSFDALTPENVMKMEYIHPERNRYNFADADLLVDFAEANGRPVHGHTLVWHEQLPQWITSRRWSAQELSDAMRDHIDTVMGHYRGRVGEWDVVNEPFQEDGSFRPSVWHETLGPAFIEQALRFAHRADPSAKLFINDFNNEGGPKAEAMVRVVRDLKSRGVPIHGVGLQMHWGAGPPPSVADIVRSLRRYTDLGVEVQITEMDVGLNPSMRDLAEHREHQQAMFTNAALACNAVPECSRFTVWGVGDKYTWRGAETEPLLLDSGFNAKPVYHSVRGAFAPR